MLQHAKEWEKCLRELPQFPSFRGEAWAVVPSPRPFLNHEQWTKVRDLAKERAEDHGLNPERKRQHQELYWFLLMCVGAALRVGEAYSLRWRDCELVRLDDKDKTEAVHMKVLGKHSAVGSGKKPTDSLEPYPRSRRCGRSVQTPSPTMRYSPRTTAKG